MAMPPSGIIAMSQINDELARAYNTTVSLDDGVTRNLAGIGSGTISLDNLHGKSAYTPMSAYGSDGYSEGEGTGVGNFTGYCFPTVNVSLGSGGYTFLWSFTAQNGATLTGNSPTSQNPQVGHSIGKFGYYGTATLQCVITDNTGHAVTVSNIVCTWNYTDPSAG